MILQNMSLIISNEQFAYSLSGFMLRLYLVNGNWGAWGTFACNCATGLQKRARLCDDPPPSNGGDFCFGDSSQSNVCAATCFGTIKIVIATYN